MVYSRAGSSDLFSPSAEAFLTSCARAFPVCVSDHVKEDWYQLMVVSKSIVAKGGFRGGPWEPRYPPPLLSLLNISALHVQNGIQAFAKFKRPECSRLHLRELQSQKFSRRSMRQKLPRKGRRSNPFAVLMDAIAPTLPLYTISPGPLYHKIIRPPLVSLN